MSVPLEFIHVTTVHVLTVSTQAEVMSVFVSQATLEMERLASHLVLLSSIASREHLYAIMSLVELFWGEG